MVLMTCVQTPTTSAVRKSLISHRPSFRTGQIVHEVKAKTVFFAPLAITAKIENTPNAVGGDEVQGVFRANHTFTQGGGKAISRLSIVAASGVRSESIRPGVCSAVD